jgi:hypothetical protein
MRTFQGRVVGRASSWLALVAGSVAVFVSGCVTTTLDPPANPDNPRTVFLIDHGRHSSLVISTDDGELIRWAYGDWRYYADQDTSLSSGASALLWETPATLARGELHGPPELAVLLSQLRVGVEDTYGFEVSGADADLLLVELDDLFIRGASGHQYVAAYDMTFSPHPEPYTWRNNSATMIGRWMSQLGVEVTGWSLVASWKVVGPEDK